jgi:hypothetical protein
MRIFSPLVLLWSYCGGTGDFFLFNLIFSFLFSLVGCAGDFSIRSVDVSLFSLPSP